MIFKFNQQDFSESHYCTKPFHTAQYSLPLGDFYCPKRKRKAKFNNFPQPIFIFRQKAKSSLDLLIL